MRNWKVVKHIVKDPQKIVKVLFEVVLLIAKNKKTSDHRGG